MESIFGGKAWVEAPAIATSDGPLPPTSVAKPVSSSPGNEISSVVLKFIRHGMGRSFSASCGVCCIFVDLYMCNSAH